MKILNLTLTIAISLLTGSFFGGAVQAQAQQSAQAKSAPRTGDVFNRQPEVNGGTIKRSPAQTWFNAFDTTITAHMPGSSEKVILSRSFNQEAERVGQYKTVAGRVAKNYRELAKQLRDMEVPTTLGGVKEYRDFTAEWYDDAASVYETLLKPKKPAKTIEELDDELKRIKDRAESLKLQKKTLYAMDMNIRNKLKVHLNDSLWKYVSTR
jgi:hypothetical protein